MDHKAEIDALRGLYLSYYNVPQIGDYIASFSGNVHVVHNVTITLETVDGVKIPLSEVWGKVTKDLIPKSIVK